MMPDPNQKASLSCNRSIISPASVDPASIPRLWAMVMRPIREPMESFSPPLKTAIAIWAGMEVPPPQDQFASIGQLLQDRCDQLGLLGVLAAAPDLDHAPFVVLRQVDPHDVLIR